MLLYNHSNPDNILNISNLTIHTCDFLPAFTYQALSSYTVYIHTYRNLKIQTPHLIIQKINQDRFGPHEHNLSNYSKAFNITVL